MSYIYLNSGCAVDGTEFTGHMTGDDQCAFRATIFGVPIEGERRDLFNARVRGAINRAFVSGREHGPEDVFAVEHFNGGAFISPVDRAVFETYWHDTWVDDRQGFLREIEGALRLVNEFDEVEPA